MRTDEICHGRGEGGGMKVKVKVTFEMEFDPKGESKTEVSFSLPDYPKTACPEGVKPLVLGEIRMLCGAAIAAGEKSDLFSESGGPK